MIRVRLKTEMGDSDRWRGRKRAGSKKETGQSRARRARVTSSERRCTHVWESEGESDDASLLVRRRVDGREEGRGEARD